MKKKIDNADVDESSPIYFPSPSIRRKVMKAQANIGKLRQDLTEKDIDDEYEALGHITRFKSKEDFLSKAMGTPYQIKKQWEYIRKRDLLIRTGQFRQIKNRIFKKNFFTMLEQNNIPITEDIERLKALPSSVYDDLSNVLPMLDTKYKGYSDDEIDNINTEIANAVALGEQKLAERKKR